MAPGEKLPGREPRAKHCLDANGRSWRPLASVSRLSSRRRVVHSVAEDRLPMSGQIRLRRFTNGI